MRDVAAVEIDGHVVVELYARIREAIEQRCGHQAASLLAEPRLTRGNGVADSRIDWYATVDGVVKPLSELDPGSLAAVRARLQERLAAIGRLTSDPTIGPYVAAAFNIPSADAILSVGGEPVMIHWATLPLGVLQHRGARQELFENGLGRYAPGLALPPVSLLEWRNAHPDAAAAPISGETPAPTAGETKPERRWGLTGPAVACVLAALALFALLWPGVLRYPGDRQVPASHLDAMRAVLATLQSRADDLKHKLGETCDQIRAGLTGPDASIAPRLDDVRVAPAPATPVPPEPGSRAAEPPPAEPPVAPPVVTTPPPAGRSQLPDRAERGVVLVIRKGAEGGQGTGFFVTPHTVVTNRHVTKGGDDILIMSKYVGVLPAKLVAEGGSGAFDDFAMLRVSPQANVSPFSLSSSAPQLEPVVASGFPALHSETNPAFARLMSGDGSALTDIQPSMTRGEINATQAQPTSITALIHSASISPGNSGGPLIDYCGRVLGVNTFVTMGERMPVAAYYALGADGLHRFLKSHGLTVALDAAPCTPVTASLAPPAAASPQAELPEAPSQPASPTPGAQPAPGPASPRPPAARP